MIGRFKYVSAHPKIHQRQSTSNTFALTNEISTSHKSIKRSSSSIYPLAIPASESHLILKPILKSTTRCHISQLKKVSFSDKIEIHEVQSSFVQIVTIANRSAGCKCCIVI